MDIGGRCERLLIGQGGDTWDPVCWLAEGHDGICRPAEDAVPRLEAQLAGLVAERDELRDLLKRAWSYSDIDVPGWSKLNREITAALGGQ